jgi:hypothetical protein
MAEYLFLCLVIVTEDFGHEFDPLNCISYVGTFGNVTETQDKGLYDGLPELLGRFLYVYLYPLLGADEVSR